MTGYNALFEHGNMEHVSIFALSTHIFIEVLLTEKDASRKLELDMIAGKFRVTCREG